MGNDETRRTPETDAAEPSEPYDPYARRPGYATGADGRTDTWTTAIVAGVVTGFAVIVVAGFVHVPPALAYVVGAVLGLAVWSVLRGRRRAADRRAGRDPDEVARVRSRATAAANQGRTFFVAQNPVVVIVMGGIFLALAVVRATSTGSVIGFVVAAVLAASALFFIVQGTGTLVLRRRDRVDAGTGHGEPDHAATRTDG